MVTICPTVPYKDVHPSPWSSEHPVCRVVGGSFVGHYAVVYHGLVAVITWVR